MVPPLSHFTPSLLFPTCFHLVGHMDGNALLVHFPGQVLLLRGLKLGSGLKNSRGSWISFTRNFLMNAFSIFPKLLSCLLVFNYRAFNYDPFTSRNWPKCNHSIYNSMRLLVICNYIWTFLQLFLVLVIFATTLQLVCNYFGVHPSM